MRVRIEKHWRGEEEMNGKHEEGGVKGLRKDCACLIIEIIICNHLPPTTRDNPRAEEKQKKEEVKDFKKSPQSVQFPPLLLFEGSSI